MSTKFQTTANAVIINEDGDIMQRIEYIYTIPRENSDLVCSVVRGNCLEPDIRDGNFIVIDRAASVNDGDIIYCILDEGAYLGRLRKVRGQCWIENNQRAIKIDHWKEAYPVVEVIVRL